MQTFFDESATTDALPARHEGTEHLHAPLAATNPGDPDGPSREPGLTGDTLWTTTN